ncbi:unnamed protein product [Parajaminaea phylloscopi]
MSAPSSSPVRTTPSAGAAATSTPRTSTSSGRTIGRVASKGSTGSHNQSGTSFAPALHSPPVKRWPFLRPGSSRPTTASTVQSFASASPDLASDSDETEGRSSPFPRSSAAATAGPSALNRTTSNSSTTTAGSVSTNHGSSVGHSVRANRRSSGLGPSKIGKSFEAVLASNETWVLKETAEVADEGAGHPDTSLPSELSADGSIDQISNTGTVRRIISRPARYTAGDSEDLPSSSDARYGGDSSTDVTPTMVSGPLTSLQQNVPTGAHVSSQGAASKRSVPSPVLPVYPGPTITRVSVSRTGEQDLAPADDVQQSGQRSNMSMPFPKNLRAPGPARVHVMNPPPPPPTPGKETSIPSNRSRAPIVVAGPSKSVADELGVLPNAEGGQQAGSSFRDRFKKTSGLFRRFKGSNAGQTTAGNNTQPQGKVSSKQQRSAAGASTPSLHQSLSAMKPRKEGIARAGSVPSSPAASAVGFSIEASQKGPDPVPEVPSIPSKFTTLPASKPGSSPVIRSTSSPARPPRSTPPMGLTKSLSGGNAPASLALAEPIQLVPAAPESRQTTSPTKPPPAARGPIPGRHQSRPSGADLLLKIKAWETEMDDALKESARDLDQKTKLTPKQTWGPVPELPQLGLGIDLDHSTFTGNHQAALVGASTSGTNNVSLKVNEASRLGRALEGPSSAPSTPTTRAGTVSARDDRRVVSAIANPRGHHPSDSASPNRPWERSNSPYLRERQLESDGVERPNGGEPTVVQQRTPASRSPRHPPKALSMPSNSHEHSEIAAGSNTVPDSFIGRGKGSPRSPTNASLSDSLRYSSEARRAAGHGLLRRGHESASAASVVSFETAAEGESGHALRSPEIGEPAVQYHGEENSGSAPQIHKTRASFTHDEEEDDEIDVVSHPEKSIRLVTTPATPAVPAEDATDADPSPIGRRANSSPGAASSPREPLRPVSPTALVIGSQRINTRTSSREGADSTSHTPLASTVILPQRELSEGSRDGRVTIVPPEGEASTSAADDSLQAQAKASAEKCWQEDEAWLRKEKYAEWLGGVGLLKQMARTYYFDNFDFRNTRVDTALRQLCDKLFLRAETQQVDRILASFSLRFWHCNPLPAYGSADNIHAVVFSLLLLNTDLHVADISERMTRAQFVRNTMSAIANTALANQEGMSSRPDLALGSVAETGELESGPAPVPVDSSSTTGSKRISRRNSMGHTTLFHRGNGAHGASAMRGSLDRRQEVELDALLKEMYASVKSDRIRLPTGDDDASATLGAGARRKMRSNLGPPSSAFGTAPNSKVSQFKRGSIRGIQGLLSSNNTYRSEDTASIGGSQSSLGSRSVGDSTMNPATASGSTLTYDGLTNQDSFGSRGAALVGPASNTMGFASTLTHTIIKEFQEEERAAASPHPAVDAEDEIDDDELALVGAPWAKEGVLARKQYWESPQKRAKDKSWAESFVVVQSGTLSMFKFGEANDSGNASGKAAANASPLAGAGGFVVGGGNWLSNATKLGEFSLAHCLCNALPPPGYNRMRPYVFALTLASGAVYFFQAGTEDLVLEWVSTCNYWAARQSKPPLAGGVSNMEYGWNKVLAARYPDEADDEGGYAESRLSYEALNEEDEVLAGDAGSGASPRGTDVTSPNESSFHQPGVLPDNRSVRSGRSGRSFGSRAGNGIPRWQHATQTMGTRQRSTAASIASGYAGGMASHTLSTPLFRRQAPSIRSFSFASGPSEPNAGRNSISGSASTHNGRGGGSTASVNNDRTHINEWKAPAAPTVPSNLKEDEQMELCIAYIARTEAELTEHNELRQPMLALYSPRGSNYSKALANWERKSNHLLADLVKWQSYVESLANANKLKNDLRDRRQMETALARADEEMAKVREGEEGGPAPSFG